MDFGEEVSGTGTLTDPLRGEKYRFDTFETGFTTRHYTADTSADGQTHVCLVLGYQAADGVGEVDPSAIAARVGLAETDGREPQPTYGSDSWPDDWLVNLDQAPPLRWGTIVNGGICYPMSADDISGEYLVRVDDVYATIGWHDETYPSRPFPAVGGSLGTGSTNEAAACQSYTFDDELPIELCSRGVTVELVQQALGLDADGFFGTRTAQALSEYQSQMGLPVTSQIDEATWSALGAG